MSLCFLIVLYKKKPSDSETFKSLQNCKNLLKGNCITYLWDNSPTPLSSNEIKDITTDNPELAINYIANKSNTYLSVIYNKIIRLCSRDGFLVILDHDSSFESSYIEAIIKETDNPQNIDINLFLPLIMSHNRIFSPSTEYFRLISKLWNTPKLGRVPVNKMQAINSGMVIRTNYLKDEFPGYDEHLRFYVTDLDFMYKYRSQNKDVFILDARIDHTLNFYEENNDSKAQRFKEQRRGILLISEKQNVFLYYLQFLRLVYVTIRFCLKYRTLQFV